MAHDTRVTMAFPYLRRQATRMGCCGGSRSLLRKNGSGAWGTRRPSCFRWAWLPRAPGFGGARLAALRRARCRLAVSKLGAYKPSWTPLDNMNRTCTKVAAPVGVGRPTSTSTGKVHTIGRGAFQVRQFSIVAPTAQAVFLPDGRPAQRTRRCLAEAGTSAW